MLVLSGPSVDGDAAPFASGFGVTTGAPPLARFGALGEAKAEGLLVLATKDDRFELLVVFDGVSRAGRTSIGCRAPRDQMRSGQRAARVRP